MSYFENTRYSFGSYKNKSLEYKEQEPLWVWLTVACLIWPVSFILSLAKDIQSIKANYNTNCFMRSLRLFYDNYSALVLSPVNSQSEALWIINPKNKNEGILIYEKKVYLFLKYEIYILLEPLEWLSRIERHILNPFPNFVSKEMIVDYNGAGFKEFNRKFNWLQYPLEKINMPKTPLELKHLNPDSLKAIALRFPEQERRMSWPRAVYFMHDVLTSHPQIENEKAVLQKIFLSQDLANYTLSQNSNNLPKKRTLKI